MSRSIWFKTVLKGRCTKQSVDDRNSRRVRKGGRADCFLFPISVLIFGTTESVMMSQERSC